MPVEFGKTDILRTGREVRVLALPHADFKAGGCTIDWATVPANNANTTLPDGTLVPAGTKFIRHGTVLVRITASGRFGPADSTAADGRQTFTAARRGEVYILNRTVLESEPGSTVIGDVFDGGNVFESRLLMGGANQPVRADVVTMFPNITFTKD